jgi:hypothetical protein
MSQRSGYFGEFGTNGSQLSLNMGEFHPTKKLYQLTVSSLENEVLKGSEI